MVLDDSTLSNVTICLSFVDVGLCLFFFSLAHSCVEWMYEDKAIFRLGLPIKRQRHHVSVEKPMA